MTDKEESDGRFAHGSVAHDRADTAQLSFLDAQHQDVWRLAAIALRKGLDVANELQVCNFLHGLPEMRGRLGIPDHRNDAEHTSDTICLTKVYRARRGVGGGRTDGRP